MLVRNHQDNVNLYLSPIPECHSPRPSPSFPRRRETTGQGIQQAQTNHQHRHTGFKAVSTGRCNNNTNQHRTVILASRQYPQGGGCAGKQQANTTINTPSPLMGEESKARVIKPTQSPSPLMAEDQSLSQCLTREQRVKTMHRIVTSLRT